MPGSWHCSGMRKGSDRAGDSGPIGSIRPAFEYSLWPSRHFMNPYCPSWARWSAWRSLLSLPALSWTFLMHRMSKCGTWSDTCPSNCLCSDPFSRVTLYRTPHELTVGSSHSCSRLPASPWLSPRSASSSPRRSGPAFDDVARLPPEDYKWTRRARSSCLSSWLRCQQLQPSNSTIISEAPIRIWLPRQRQRPNHRPP